MIEYYEAGEAQEELKRADHLVYVTLKYTRTVDVILNTIKRLINAYDLTIHEYLIYLKEKNKIKIIPESRLSRAELFEKNFKGKIKDYMKLYYLLLKINKSDYDKKEEYRKHITLISKIGPNKKEEVGIHRITEFFDMAKDFNKLVSSSIK